MAPIFEYERKNSTYLLSFPREIHNVTELTKPTSFFAKATADPHACLYAFRADVRPEYDFVYHHGLGRVDARIDRADMDRVYVTCVADLACKDDTSIAGVEVSKKKSLVRLWITDMDKVTQVTEMLSRITKDLHPKFTPHYRDDGQVLMDDARDRLVEAKSVINTVSLQVPSPHWECVFGLFHKLFKQYGLGGVQCGCYVFPRQADFHQDTYGTHKDVINKAFQVAYNASRGANLVGKFSEDNRQLFEACLNDILCLSYFDAIRKVQAYNDSRVKMRHDVRTIDVHFHDVPGGSYVVEEALSSACPGDKINFITGKGLHSRHNRSPLKKQVWLIAAKHGNVSEAPNNAGMLQVVVH